MNFSFQWQTEKFRIGLLYAKITKYLIIHYKSSDKTILITTNLY